MGAASATPVRQIALRPLKYPEVPLQVPHRYSRRNHLRFASGYPVGAQLGFTNMSSAGSHTHAHSDRESTILMIQWVVWKHLTPKLIMDGEKMQRLADELAEAFYSEGIRMPLDDDPLETTINLQSDLLGILKEMPPVPIPQIKIRERSRTMAQGLFRNGWRKFTTAA